jgi:hypothetical protein
VRRLFVHKVTSAVVSLSDTAALRVAPLSNLDMSNNFVNRYVPFGFSSKRAYSVTPVLNSGGSDGGMSDFTLPTLANVFPPNMSMMDREKEMFKSKRRFGVLYSQGKYVDALHQAEVSGTVDCVCLCVYIACLLPCDLLCDVGDMYVDS